MFAENTEMWGNLALQLPADGLLSAADEAAVDAVLCQQLVVGAALGDRVVEQIDVLEHEAEISHQAVHIVFPHIVPAQCDLSAVHVPEAGQQMAEGGLAAAGGAHKGVDRAFTEGQVDAVQDLRITIAKVDIVQRHGAALRGLRVRFGTGQSSSCAVRMSVT